MLSLSQHDEALCKMGHLDHKYSVLVEPTHGWVSVAVQGIAKNPTLIVCEPPTGSLARRERKSARGICFCLRLCGVGSSSLTQRFQCRMG